MTEPNNKVTPRPAPDPPNKGDQLHSVGFDGVLSTVEFADTHVNEYGYTQWVVRQPPAEGDFVWRRVHVSNNYYHRSELAAYEEYREQLANGLDGQLRLLEKTKNTIVETEARLQAADDQLRVLRGEAYDPARADFVCILSDGEPYRVRAIGDKCWLLKAHPDKRWVTREQLTDERLWSFMRECIDERYKEHYAYGVPFRAGGWPRPKGGSSAAAVVEKQPQPTEE